MKTQDGVAFCQWRELKEEHMDERATDAKLSLDAKKVSGQQAAQMAMLVRYSFLVRTLIRTTKRGTTLKGLGRVQSSGIGWMTGDTWSSAC